MLLHPLVDPLRWYVPGLGKVLIEGMAGSGSV